MGATPIEDHINPVDAFTVTLERDPLLRATIVAVATFDRSPDWEVLRDRIDRATRLVPRFRQKLVTVPFGLAPPRWVVDPDFDLTLHLSRVRVRRGGGMDAVLELARAAGLTSFDHDRPLWEFTLVEGLPGKRSALIMKLHHALTDGVGGIEIAAHVVDLAREPGPTGPMPAAPAPGDHGIVDLVTDTIGFHLRRVAGAGTELRKALPHTIRHGLAHPAGMLSDGASTAAAIARFVRPVTRTSSPIMTERRPLRDYQHLDVPLAALADAAHRRDATLNDAFLAGIAGGMRRYHERHLAMVDHLVVSMPVNVRTESDAPGGNRVTIERFELPVGTSDPGRRMERIGQICRTLRSDRAIPYASAIAGVLNLLPVDVTAGMLKHVDLLASNVPGFPDPVYMGGAQLESFHVFGATLGSAANITLMSYDGTCHIGISTDSGAVRDPATLRDCLVEGFDEVLAG
jgi:WS/DGAT/MGAT family acyltransferase